MARDYDKVVTTSPTGGAAVLPDVYLYSAGGSEPVLLCRQCARARKADGMRASLIVDADDEWDPDAQCVDCTQKKRCPLCGRRRLEVAERETDEGDVIFSCPECFVCAVVAYED